VVPAPVQHRRDAWGGFAFRAFTISPLDAAGSPIPVTLTIEFQEPLPLTLLRRIERLALSGREAEFRLLAAAGHAPPAIAERVGTSEHTAITHGRNVQAKLGVHSRTQLLARLRSA
jgi:DNA-binding CsgD family transcriptional regulator